MGCYVWLHLLRSPQRICCNMRCAIPCGHRDALSDDIVNEHVHNCGGEEGIWPLYAGGRFELLRWWSFKRRYYKSIARVVAFYTRALRAIYNAAKANLKGIALQWANAWRLAKYTRLIIAIPN